MPMRHQQQKKCFREVHQHEHTTGVHADMQTSASNGIPDVVAFSLHITTNTSPVLLMLVDGVPHGVSSKVERVCMHQVVCLMKMCAQTSAQYPSKEVVSLFGVALLVGCIQARQPVSSSTPQGYRRSLHKHIATKSTAIRRSTLLPCWCGYRQAIVATSVGAATKAQPHTFK